jgi:competence protein ComEC
LTDDLATGTSEEVSLLEAMVLGHRLRFDRRLNEVFIRAGVIHFIAVSGTNVAILMSFVWSIGRLLRRTKRRCTWLMILSIITYALVADPRPPILRATIMGLLFCASLLLHRPTTTLNWTSAAAVILILFDPTSIFDAGFQLSFAAVLGVGYLAPALLRALVAGGLWFERVILARRFAVQDRQLARAAAMPSLGPGRHVRRLWRVVSKYAVILVVAGVAAWLAGLPIVAAYFHRVQPWGAISSAIVFPLMSIVMILGVIKVAITAVSPGMASVVAVLLDVTDGWLVRIVEVFAALPGTDLTAFTPPWWLVIAYYVLLVAFVFRFPQTPKSESWRWGMRQFRTTQTALPPVSCLAALAILVLCSIAWCWPEGRREHLRMTVLAVGRGSATVIELPDGQTILYDAGTSLPSDTGRNVVGPFLNHRGIRHIDRVYISHPDLDHFSGIPTVLDQIEADAVIINPCFELKSSPRSPSRHLLELLSARGQSVQLLDTSTTTWELGGVVFELLWPRGDCDPQLSSNETSTVLRLNYAGRSILLTGDIEGRAQRALLERGDLHADVLMLLHHGSLRATSVDFIRAVAPFAAIRSSNERTQQTLSGLDAAIGDVPLYNTADVGAVEVVLDREGVHIATPCWVTK